MKLEWMSPSVGRWYLARRMMRRHRKVVDEVVACIDFSKSLKEEVNDYLRQLFSWIRQSLH